MSTLSKKMSFFERHLTMWVFVCMVVGVGIGYAFPGFIGTVRSMEIAGGSQINIPIMILIWLMIYPMMLKIDFTSIKNAGKKPKRSDGYTFCKLDRETVQYGVSGLAVL